MNHLPRAELCAVRAVRFGIRNTSTRWGGYQFLEDKPGQTEKPPEIQREQVNPAAGAGEELKQLKKKTLHNQQPKQNPPKQD